MTLKKILLLFLLLSFWCFNNGEIHMEWQTTRDGLSGGYIPNYQTSITGGYTGGTGGGLIPLSSVNGLQYQTTGSIPTSPVSGGGTVAGVSTTNNTTSRTATGGGNNTNVNADDYAYLDEQEGLLRQLLGRADGSLTSGLNNLTDSYNLSKTRANEDQSNRLTDFNTKQVNTEKGREKSINNVDQNARTLRDSVMRMLGMAGGRSSSQEVAGNAVAREASKNRTNVLEDYGQNMMQLDQGRKRNQTEFERFLQDLDMQKNEKEQQLRTGIDSERSSVNQRLAEIARQRAGLQGGTYSQLRAASAPYMDAISQADQRIAGYNDQFRNPTLSVAPVRAQQLNLKDYVVDRVGINGQGNTQQQYSPYSNFLPKNQEEEQLRVL
jgi:flagellar biosynthesis/type III secretory pathway protein FliH